MSNPYIMHILTLMDVLCIEIESKINPRCILLREQGRVRGCKICAMFLVKLIP